MVRLLRCLVLAQITPKLHYKEAKRRFIVSIATISLKLPHQNPNCNTLIGKFQKLSDITQRTLEIY